MRQGQAKDGSLQYKSFSASVSIGISALWNNFMDPKVAESSKLIYHNVWIWLKSLAARLHLHKDEPQGATIHIITL